MVACASCQRQFQTIQACQQHARDKGHVYEVPTVTVVQSAPQTASSNGVSDNQTSTAQQLEGRVHCSICVVNVESESALKTHYREANVHPNCPCCPEGFRDQTALDVHIKAAHNVPTPGASPQAQLAIPLRHTCFICTKVFETSELLDSHTTSAHSAVLCCPCNKIFRTNQALQDHYRNSSAHLCCNLCQVGLRDDSAYAQHMVSVHPKSKVTSSPLSVHTMISAGPSSVTAAEMQSLPSTPLLRRPALVVERTSAPGSPGTAVFEFQERDRAESTSSMARAVSEPTLPSASSLGEASIVGDVVGPYSVSCSVAGSVASHLSGNPTSPALTERTLDYISRPGMTPTRSASSSSVSSVSLRSVHSSDADSDIHSHMYDILNSPRTPVIPPVSERDEIAPSRVKTPNTVTLHDGHTVTVVPDVPSRSAAFRPVEIASEHVQRQSAPVPASVRSSVSKPASIISLPPSNVRRSATVATQSVHEISTDTDMTVRDTSRSPIHPPRRPKSPKGISWHCRVCFKDPCDQPTATMCGHLFCNSCILKELSENMQCPVCKRIMLLRLHVGAD
ncbi:hypothetical protein AcW1_001867 [Taiwanofungus camphoratus]|nr:hypothetical protein AcW1_001867 [Antrodia cinnamomea]